MKRAVVQISAAFLPKLLTGEVFHDTDVTFSALGLAEAYDAVREAEVECVEWDHACRRVIVYLRLEDSAPDLFECDSSDHPSEIALEFTRQYSDE